MTIEQVIFYGTSALLIAAALAVISVRNSVRAVLFLVLTFFAAAGLWLLAESEFLAVSLILVYVGAVMVLFLFVVMMIDIDFATMRQGFSRHLVIGILAALAFFGGLYKLIGSASFGLQQQPLPPAHPASYSNVTELGKLLYTHYFYPFEVAGVILLVAMMAAVSLTFRGSRGRKTQNVGEQVKVRKEDRLRIVKMDAEKRNGQ